MGTEAYNFLRSIVNNELANEEERVEAIWQLVEIGNHETVAFLMEIYTKPATLSFKVLIIKAIGSLAAKLKGKSDE